MFATKTNQADANTHSSNESSTVENTSEKDLTSLPSNAPNDQITPGTLAPLANGDITGKEITPPDGVFPLDSPQTEPEKFEAKESEAWVEVQRRKKVGKPEIRVSYTHCL